MSSLSVSAQIEGLLFYRAKPVEKREVAMIFGLEDEELVTAVVQLRQELHDRGIALIETSNDLQLATHPDLDPLIDSLRKDELSREIGKAGAETLAIILYRGPIGRAEIEQIRGVNCQHIVRNLLIRGLIERDESTRQPRYRGTTELLAHLGISKREELPNFATTMNTLDAYEASLTIDTP